MKKAKNRTVSLTLTCFIAVIILSQLFISLCLSSSPEESYFPLSLGRTWNYKVTDCEGRIFQNSRTVVEQKEISGINTYGVYEKLHFNTTYFAIISDELRLYGLSFGEKREKIITISSPKNYITILKFPLNVGTIIDEDIHLLSNEAPLHIKSQVLSKEDDENTYKIKIITNYGRLKMIYNYWLSKGKGIIKVQGMGKEGNLFYTEELMNE